MPKKENNIKLKESDLYLPVKQLLSRMGYAVKGEVKDCDVVAVKDDITVIVELKLLFNLKVLLQAVERIPVSGLVYIAIPDTCTAYSKESKQIDRMLKMLGIGLILVTTGSKGKAVPTLDPQPYTPKKNKKKLQGLLKEFHALPGDPNLGGSSTRQKKLTAYRFRSITILKFLIDNGATKASIIKEELNDPKAREIVYNNHYDWFEAQGKGIYKATPKGETEYHNWKHYLS